MDGNSLDAKDETIGQLPFLAAFFDVLSSDGVRYAVMRHYETLPYCTGGSDVDIVILEGDFVCAQEVLIDCIVRSAGTFTLIGVVKTPNFFGIHVMGCANGVWWGDVV